MPLLTWNWQRIAEFRGARAIDVVERNVKMLMVVMPHDVLGSARCKTGFSFKEIVAPCCVFREVARFEEGVR